MELSFEEVKRLMYESQIFRRIHQLFQIVEAELHSRMNLKKKKNPAQKLRIVILIDYKNL